MSTKKTAKNPSVHTSTASQAKAMAVKAGKMLNLGTPLTPKRRKEVRGAALNVTPEFLAAAASAYKEYASLLGNDLDPQAALDAQAYVTEMTPVAGSFKSVTRAVEDAILTHNVTSAQFALAVYSRLEGVSRLPQNAKVASRVEQMEALMKKRLRKKATSEESSPATEPAAPTAAKPAGS